MSRDIEHHGTEIGTISLAVITCDHCGKRTPDDSVHRWLEVRRLGVLVEEWEELHFCSADHLTEWCLVGRVIS